jgi:hypothetical protein
VVAVLTQSTLESRCESAPWNDPVHSNDVSRLACRIGVRTPRRFTPMRFWCPIGTPKGRRSGHGRYVEEIETAMKFDGGRWSILQAKN